MKNNKTLKRFLAFLLCAAMMITYMPSSVYTLAGDPAGDTATEEQQKEAAGVNETEGVSDDAENSERESVQEAEESKQEETSDLKGEQSSGQSGEDQDQDEEVDDTVKKEMLADENAQAVTKKSDDDDKEAYPEQHFNKTENGTGITIKVDAATGVFPAGSDMTIESVDMDTVISAIGQNEGAKAVKISFQDKDGKAIAPAEKGMVTVTVEAKNLEEGKTYKVFHIDGSNAAEEELGASFVTDDVVFAVVGTDKPAKASRGETRSTDTAWEVRFRNRDGEVFETREIEKAEGGTALGELPPVIEREDYNAFWAIGTYKEDGQGGSWGPGDYVNTETMVTSDLDIVPAYEKITYTVTFYAEDKTTVVDTKTVDVGTSYCLNEMPDVPEKAGSVGKWVYQDGEQIKGFSNSVINKVDRDVWAAYDQNVFTVTYKVEGSTYETDTYYIGDELTLPADPVVEGKQFTGWYVGETKYEGGEEVDSDLVLVADFEDEYFVKFIIKHDGQPDETLSQYFRTEGERIGTMPQNPFVAGKVFVKWVVQGTDTEVTADTVVNNNMTVEAVFRTVDIYNITAEYYYMNDRGEEVTFNTDYLQVEAHELPYTITAPESTKTSPDQVSGAPIYYPETPSVEITEEDFNGGTDYTVRFEYVPYTAVYDYVYLLKNLNGGGYTEIERVENVQGVLNSYVTPTVKQYDYAVLELAEGVTIETSGMDGQPKQEIPVYYTRKNFQLTYETNGGSYVA